MRTVMRVVLFCLAFFGVSGGTLVSLVHAESPSTLVYTLVKEVGVCKENCRHSGVRDCVNRNERRVVTVPISKPASRILIDGRATADASSVYSDGTVSAVFQSESGMKKNKGINIPARSSISFQMGFDLETPSRGSVKIYLGVSDWCTYLTEMEVRTTD